MAKSKRGAPSNTWIVYKHTSPEGKIYIGITSKTPKQRWANGKGYSGNKHFQAAINKYGWENFEHDVLYEGLSQEEACNKEIELIEVLHSNNPKIGYNITKGGEGFVLNEEQRKERIQLKRAKEARGGSATLQEVLNNLDKIYEMSNNGYSKKEMALHFGISRQTFYEYEKLEPDISDTIKKGRCKVVDDIKQAMLKRAVGFQYEEKKVTTQQIVLDGPDGIPMPAKVVKTEVTTKTALPDPAAGLILLQHWDLNEDGSTKWSRDPANRELKKEELEIKKKQAEDDAW